MGRAGSTAEIRVWFATTIASKTAPTVAELTAATDLTPLMRRDGLTTPRSAELIDSSDAASHFNKRARSNFGGDALTFRGYRDSVAANDTAWTALDEGATGYLVVRRFGGSTTAAAAAQKVEVYPVEVASREMQPIADNETQNFIASMAITDDPAMDATLAT